MKCGGFFVHTMKHYVYTIHTHTQDDYSNPRCACAPRVNNSKGSHSIRAVDHAPR